MFVEPIASTHLEGIRVLFESAGSGCFCRYWHFTGNKNEWLDRCAHRPGENLAEMAAAIDASDPSADGLVAVGDPATGEPSILGWMKLTKRSAVPKLTRLPVYRSISPVAGAEDATWAIGCFLIHPLARRRGVARALVTAAEAHVRAAGGRVIEAFPRRSTDILYDEEVWQGPESVFRSLGYEVVFPPGHYEGEDGVGGDALPYPLYRRLVDPPRPAP